MRRNAVTDVVFMEKVYKQGSYSFLLEKISLIF